MEKFCRRMVWIAHFGEIIIHTFRVLSSLSQTSRSHTLSTGAIMAPEKADSPHQSWSLEAQHDATCAVIYATETVIRTIIASLATLVPVKQLSRPLSTANSRQPAYVAWFRIFHRCELPWRDTNAKGPMVVAINTMRAYIAQQQLSE